MKVQSRSDIVGGRTTEMGSKVHWMGEAVELQSFHRDGELLFLTVQDGQHQRDEIGVNWGQSVMQVQVQVHPHRIARTRSACSR
jgi:hypothetical protein